MSKRGAAVAVVTLVSACAMRPPTDTFYQPSVARMEVRTAQNLVRTALMRADHIGIDGRKHTISDVRFRNDGIGLLVTRQGQQTMQACYYSAMDLRVVKNNGYWPMEPQYIIGPICPGNDGKVWIESQSEATGLVDALHSLRSGSR